ncbi:hypothetical protein CXB51_004154 [Gossypium anomalum]|uniref:Legumain prodomain domain-containing protein n=1 Tax=Gossypium anomalum TaxID=47600 RepID=A0A8J6DAW1_9ROSI|nr:hypothetical protein CXB51_004154 [Gossypium anomalum]
MHASIYKQYKVLIFLKLNMIKAWPNHDSSCGRRSSSIVGDWIHFLRWRYHRRRLSWENIPFNNFFSVILRNKAALTGGSGKVINSGPNDRIFIYYSDHGGSGTLGMPDKSHLYAEQLIQGSMLEGLLHRGLNIYATTAANKEESSWATYCPGGHPSPPPDILKPVWETYTVFLGWKTGLCPKNDTAGQPLVDGWNCLREMVMFSILSLIFRRFICFFAALLLKKMLCCVGPTQVTFFEIHYGKLAQYGMKHMLSFANICNAGIRTEQMVEASAEAYAGIHSDH